MKLFSLLKFKGTWVRQQFNDMKHTCRSTSDWPKIRVLEGPYQRLDLNPIEMLWHALNKKQQPKNFLTWLKKTKQFFKVCTRIPPLGCKRLKASCYCQQWETWYCFMTLGLGGDILFTKAYTAFWLNKCNPGQIQNCILHLLSFNDLTKQLTTIKLTLKFDILSHNNQNSDYD